MPGGYEYSLPETLRMIDLYYNSQYKTGKFDSLGYRKFFYNITKPACDIGTKFIDLDTKDIILIPEGNDDELVVWFMQKKLKMWLRDTDFATLLNDIAWDLPKYGTVVVKKTSKGWKKVNIQNLRLNPRAKTLNDTFLYELIDMSRSELLSKKWDLTKLDQRGVDTNYLIYDCYEPSEGGWKHQVWGDLFSTKKEGGINRSVESETTNTNEYSGGLLLFKEELDELPYREVHWEKLPGRWLGYGFVEYLEENQIAINEAENLERRGLIFTALKIYQTRDPTLGGSNILTATQNGDILHVESEITPISMEERNLAAFNNTRANWTANTERKTFTTDITTGASLPSRTPLGVANLQATFAQSYFENKREIYGIFVKKLLTDDTIPGFVRENSKEHILMFSYSEQDMDLLDEMISDILVGNATVDFALRSGFFPSQLQREQFKTEMKSQFKKEKNRYLKIAKNLYRDAKYHVDVLITGEQIDNGVKSQVLQLALQIIGQNPGIVQNPVTRQILFNLLAMGGISPAELGLMSSQVREQMGPMTPEMQAQGTQMGGSVAAPMPTSGVQMDKTMMI